MLISWRVISLVGVLFLGMKCGKLQAFTSLRSCGVHHKDLVTWENRAPKD